MQKHLDTFLRFVEDMNGLHAQNPKVLAQSIGVDSTLIDDYLDLLRNIFLLEE